MKAQVKLLDVRNCEKVRRWALLFAILFVVFNPHRGEQREMLLKQVVIV